MIGDEEEGRAEMREQVAKREDLPLNPSFQMESGPFLRTALGPLDGKHAAKHPHADCVTDRVESRRDRRRYGASRLSSRRSRGQSGRFRLTNERGRGRTRLRDLLRFSRVVQSLSGSERCDRRGEKRRCIIIGQVMMERCRMMSRMVTV